MNPSIEHLLGPISPIRPGAEKPAAAKMEGSLSFQQDLQENAGFTAQSRPPARAPFGERANLQSAAFEFGRPAGTKPAAFGTFKPFAAVPSQVATEMPTPASVACTETDGTPMSHDQRAATPSSVGAASAAAATPLPAATPPPTLGGSSVPAAAAGSTWGDVFLWHDPVATALLFLCGLALYWTASWALRGGTPMTPTSAVAYLLLAHLGLNFLRFFVSARWHAACLWEGAGWTEVLAEAAVRAVRRLSALHDAYLSAKDPHVTLVVALSLWGIAWLGVVLSANQLLFWGYLAAFTLPAACAANRATVDARLAQLHAATLGRLDATEMPRTARLVVLMTALAGMLLLTTWPQFAIATLVAATYWRTTLAPAEVEAIRIAAEPLTHDVTASVRKVRARLSMVLDDARALCSTAGPASRTAPRTRKAHAA